MSRKQLLLNPSLSVPQVGPSQVSPSQVDLA
jgi:hypothetical protein